MTEVVLDFETCNPVVDLTEAGADRYAEDMHTEILSLTFYVNGEFYLWVPEGTPRADALLHELAETPSVYFVSHARFEQCIWRSIMVQRFGFPPIGVRRWIDTQASCAMKALPLDLDRALTVLNLPVTKDKEGKKITLSLSKFDERQFLGRGKNRVPNPRFGMLPERTPELMGKVYAYNRIDVDGTVALLGRVGRLPASERRVWILDQEVNNRGVRLDMEFVRAAQEVVKKSIGPLTDEFRSLTGFEPTQRDKVLGWCVEQGAWWLADLKKETLSQILGDDDAGSEDGTCGGSDDLPANVRRALDIRNIVASASIKKLARMEMCVCADGRARGLVQYHGAQPGRWAGRILQPQNFPRGTVKVGNKSPDPASVVRAILTGSPDCVRSEFGAEPIQVVAGALRHVIIADPGKYLVAGDFAGIEARIVLALAGNRTLLNAIARGEDVYCLLASAIYRREILPNKEHQPPERQEGKNTFIGCGYGLGADSFCRKYMPGCECRGSFGECRNPENPDRQVAGNSIYAYRKQTATEVPKVWQGLGYAAIQAVYDLENKPYESHGITYQKEDGWLTCRLWSGRKIYYWNPQPCRKPDRFNEGEDVAGWTYEGRKENHWTTVHPFGGSLTNNVCEGIARDILVEAMLKCDAQNIPVVLTVHDEIVTETDWALEGNLKQIMEDKPKWAKDIPIDAEVWAGDRYRK